MKPKDFKNIAIAQTAFLGDVVLTTPLFRALRRLYPEARLTLFTTPAAKPLVEEDPNLDAIITYDKHGGESFFSALKKLRSGDFDLLIAPHRSYRTSLLGFFSEIPVRVGYQEADWSFLYTRKVHRPMELHEVDRILSLLKALGAAPLPGDRVLCARHTNKEALEIAAILSEAGVSSEEKLIGFAPGSVWATKRWPAGNFAALGRLLEAQGYRIVLIGGPDDRETAAEVGRGLSAQAVNAAGKTSLKALSAWMERFSLFVTNDSAPLHVAAAKNVPTVALFGATVRELGFYPFHERAKVVEVQLPCRPCGLHGHKECPRGHFKCMKDLSPEAAYAACLELLKGAG